jgi:glycerophosphoryl diester phosphodiesterase
MAPPEGPDAPAPATPSRPADAPNPAGAPGPASAPGRATAAAAASVSSPAAGPALGEPSAPRQLAIAHRGLHDGRSSGSSRAGPPACPENTLAAFTRAVAAGADGIETDVRLSRDGLPVLFHDRIAPGGRAVADLTAEELSAAAGYPVPTLDLALEIPAGEDLLWNVEIKTPAAVPAALEVLAGFAARRRILVTSFWHALVPAFRRLGVETGLLLASRPLDAGALFGQLPPDGSAGTLVWDFEMLDPDLLAAAARRGLRNLTYGAESAEEHRRCRALAAHLGGVITDHLALFQQLVRPPS